jgi:hypothetical protein
MLGTIKPDASHPDVEDLQAAVSELSVKQLFSVIRMPARCGGSPAQAIAAIASPRAASRLTSAYSNTQSTWPRTQKRANDHAL